MLLRITRVNLNLHGMTLELQFQYYCCVQHDFTEAQKLVDSYVRDLYVLPKKFVESTGPALDRYIKEYSFADEKRKNATPYEAVLDFIDQLDDFTENTVALYEHHKKHAEKSRKYLNKVEWLSRKSKGKIVKEYAGEFIGLTPELSVLNNGLKQIKTQADEMVEMLEKLELRWEGLQMQVRA
jgi:hypothetical protein